MRLLLLCLLAMPAWGDFADPMTTRISTEWSVRGGVEHHPEDGGFARMYFNKAGFGNQPGIAWKFPGAQNEVTVQFDYRMSPGEDGGSKLLKLFGVRTDSYSNVTFPQEYYSGSWKGSEFGDNADSNNDSQSFVRFAGNANTLASVTTSSVQPTRQNQEAWHNVKIHWKQSDDYKANGEVDIWINGTLRLSANGFKNRGDGHGHLERMTIGDYTHAPSQGGKSFHMDVRNVSVSFGGAQEAAPPMPPKVF